MTRAPQYIGATLCGIAAVAWMAGATLFHRDTIDDNVEVEHWEAQAEPGQNGVRLTIPTTPYRSSATTVEFDSQPTYEQFSDLVLNLERDYRPEMRQHGRRRFTDEEWLQIANRVDDPMIAGRTITATEVLNARQLYDTQGKDAFDIEIYTPSDFLSEYENSTRAVDQYHHQLRETQQARQRMRDAQQRFNPTYNQQSRWPQRHNRNR